MARWRLTAKHYLYVPGTEWEYQEEDRDTGQVRRQRLKVPRFLDPENGKDWTEGRDIVVCWAGKGQRRDLPFEGPPTADMEPLDEEAEEVSRKESVNWKHPIDSLPGQGDYSQSLLNRLVQQIDTLAAKGSVTPAPASTDSSVVSAQDFRELQEQVAKLMARNIDLERSTI